MSERRLTRFDVLTKPNRALLMFGVVLGGILVLALLAEVGVRVRSYVRHGTGFLGIEKLYQVDAVTGLRIPRPGQKNSHISINSLGFRGPEITIPKPKNVTRIAFLGASTTFSAEVKGNGATWPHIVAKTLRRKWPNRRFDYINAGVPGYTINSSLKNLEARVKRLEPDVIVIYHASNDLSRNSYKAALRQGVAQTRGDQSLSWFSEYSLLWYLVEKNLHVRKLQRESSSEAGKLKVDCRALAEPFKRDLKALVKVSRKVADIVVLVTFSTRFRSEQGSEERREAAVTSLYYMPYMTPDSLIACFAAYNQAITEVARDPTTLLIDDETAIPGDRTHFVDSIHFTNAGSRAMAVRIINGLTESGAVAF